MVSLRRRRLLGYTSDVPLPDIYDEGFPVRSYTHVSTPVNEYHMPMDEAEQFVEATNQINAHHMPINEVVKPMEVLNLTNVHPPPHTGEVEPPREVTNPMNIHPMPFEIDLNEDITGEIKSPSVSPYAPSTYGGSQPSFSHSAASEEQEQMTEPVTEQEAKPRKQYRRKNKHDEEEMVMRGVYYRNKKWQAAIKVNKKQVHLATLSTQTEAAHLYDRAAYVCGRETNFELPDEEKEELKNLNWDEFLALTKSSRKTKRFDEGEVASFSVQNSSSEGGEQGVEGISASDEPDSIDLLVRDATQF